MPKLDSYRSCECGSDCDFLDTRKDESCWGFVQPVEEVYDEDNYYWVHACEGHNLVNYGGKYREEG